MPAKKEKEPKIDENKEKIAALERKIAAIFQGMLEFKQDLKKIKSRMGL